MKPLTVTSINWRHGRQAEGSLPPLPVPRRPTMITLFLGNKDLVRGHTEINGNEVLQNMQYWLISLILELAVKQSCIKRNYAFSLKLEK